jgi:hypothetical protein
MNKVELTFDEKRLIAGVVYSETESLRDRLGKLEADQTLTSEYERDKSMTRWVCVSTVAVLLGWTSSCAYMQAVEDREAARVEIAKIQAPGYRLVEVK